MTHNPSSPDPVTTEELAARVLELSTRTVDLVQYVRADLSGMRSDIRDDLDLLSRSVRSDSVRLGYQVSDEHEATRHLLIKVTGPTRAWLLIALAIGLVLVALAIAAVVLS